METPENLQEPQSVTPIPTVIQKPKDYLYTPRVIFCILGMVLGLCLVITVIFDVHALFDELNTYSGTYIDSAEFGGDFYTYIYEGVQKTGNNVHNVTISVNKFARNCCLLFGSGFFLGFGIKLFEVIAQHKRYQEGM
ncbi:MAG: hypothetical protein IJ644_11580 [Oscillospiraceae bacterium]|nr:hypothetical protein [Oscillospiraceae bacterium]